MLNIRELSRLLGISPQTVRKYEEQGIFEAERNSSNYRKFDRSAITTLMKCRKLMGMGFSIRQVMEIARGVTYKEGQKMLKQQAEKLEKEMRLLNAKRNGVVHMYNLMREIEKQKGQCILRNAPEMYFCPVMRNDELLIGKDSAWLDKWNEYAFIRHDVKRVPKEAVLDGSQQKGYVAEYAIPADKAHRIGLDVSHAYHMDEHLCLWAYAVCPANERSSIWERFSFVKGFLQEKRLNVVADPIIFLPFWPQQGEHEDHLMMVLYVEETEKE